MLGERRRINARAWAKSAATTSKPCSATKCRPTPTIPTLEGDWKLAGLLSGGKATLSRFIPGTKVWVRVRTVGLKAVMGIWE